MKNRWLVLFMFFLIFPSCVKSQVEVPIENSKSTEKRIEIYVHRSGDSYSVKGLEVVFGSWKYKDNYHEFKKAGLSNGAVISFKGEDLGYFLVELEMSVCRDNFLPDGTIKGGCEKITDGDLLITVPYFPNGKYADIYSPEGKKLFTIDLSSKAVCNEDKVCNKPVEDKQNCFSDCQNEISVLNPDKKSGNAEIDKITPSSQSGEEGVFSWFLLIMIVFALLFMIGFLTWKKWKSKNTL